MDNSEWKILDLGNTPLSYETARSVILDPDNADKIFREVPYINPIGGKAYIYQSPFALSKSHPKFDPYKFMFMGKGYNKEFDIMKRYYHLKHSRTDLDKQLYNFQRHIYSLTVDNSHGVMIYYLVHYFGNDYLLEAAQHRRGAPTVAEHDNGIILPDVSYDEHPIISQTTISDDDEPLSTVARYHNEVEESDSFLSHHNFISGVSISSPNRKRKSTNIPPKKYETPSPPSKKMSIDIDSYQQPAEGDSVDYLFAINIAAQLRQLPKEMKARVKFQIATVFYEAEMKALNSTSDDLLTNSS